MKKIFSMLLLTFMFACNINKPEPKKAQALAQQILDDIKSDNYTNLEKYYTAALNEGESLEKKIEKFNKLKAALGNLQSYTLTSTAENSESDQPTITLKYKLKCTKINAEQTFIIVVDEGEYKIAAQNTVTQ
jgi:hypothetical protein